MFSKFGKKKTSQETAREARRAVGRGVADLNKELIKLERNEKDLQKDIKATAKTGNQGATRALARQLIYVRKQKEKLIMARATTQGVGNRAIAAQSQAKLVGVMGTVSGVMKDINDTVDTEEMSKITHQFAMQNEKMNMREELIDETLTDAFDGEGIEEGADVVVDQVLTEIGLDLGALMSDAPTARPAVSRPSVAEEKLDAKTEEMLRQLNAL